MTTIKITSGKFKGRNISSPDSKSTHPMGAREKLALFNMISEHLPGANVLDAYAGSGALGIEALSRGASRITFIEKSPHTANTIQQNILNLNLTDSTTVIRQDVKLFSSAEKFDIILADPPYDNFRPQDLENLTNFLKDTGVLVLSHPSAAPTLSDLHLIKTHQYAAAHLSIYTK